MTGTEYSQPSNSAGSVQERVDRWVQFGGTWHVQFASEPDSALVRLSRCDGGEVVEEIIASDSADLAWLRSAAQSA
ncbi:MAG: hypothetical protein ACTJFR_06270 [Canibacter sp.]